MVPNQIVQVIKEAQSLYPVDEERAMDLAFDKIDTALIESRFSEVNDALSLIDFSSLPPDLSFLILKTCSLASKFLPDFNEVASNLCILRPSFSKHLLKTSVPK